MPHGVTGLSGAAALIFFAYLGFDEIGNFAEEMHDPTRNLPRALFISMAGATAVYLLVAVSATAAVGWQALSASTAPLALVARQALGPAADTGLSLIALAATANTVLLLLVAAARSVYGMAAAGVLPWWLGVVDRRGVPTRATLVVTAITGALVLLGDLTRVAALTDAAVLMSFLLVNLSLPWVIRRGLAGPGVARPRARFRAARPGAADVRLAARPYGVAQPGDGNRARARRASGRAPTTEPGRGCPGAGTRADRTQGLLRDGDGFACGAAVDPGCAIGPGWSRANSAPRAERGPM